MSITASSRPASSVESPPQLPEATASVEVGALSPLRDPIFRSLWIAAVISYTGSWMQNIATGWLMTSLTSSPMHWYRWH